MSELPEGWSAIKLTEVCELNPPKPKSNQIPSNLPVTFVPMAAVDAESGAITNPSIREYSTVAKGFTSFQENDVIMAKITPCMENGKAAIARGLSNGIGFGSTEFYVFRSGNAVLPEYIFHFIRQKSFRKLAEANMTGSVGQKRVPASFLNDFEIPLPPLAEQRRIVAKLETLLGKVETCQQRLAKIPVILKRFRQAVIGAACSGELTVDWRKERSDVQAYPQETNNPEVVSGLFEIPESWRWVSLASVCDYIVDCPHSTPKWIESGYLCVRTTNFKPGFLDLSEVQFVSEETYQNRIERLVPMPGDVLYSREGGILGIACIIPSDVKLCLGQRMMLMRTGRSYISPLLMHWLNSPEILKQVRDLTGGSASPHLNVRDIKSFPIPLPPIAEQQEIVRRVEALFQLADQLEARYRRAKAQVDKLQQSILAKAFRGELVPTEAELAKQAGRAYEPAAVLLERIRAERAEGESTAKPKPRKAKPVASTAPARPAQQTELFD